jgi:GNAT superfamily N-acetyltransferase
MSLSIRIRPIRASDVDLIREGFERLNARSRYQRFLGAKPHLSAAELRYFTVVDHHDHEALVAVSRLTRRGIGVARYVRNQNDPDTADLAVTVADEWQGCGVGVRLVTRLAERARREGIQRFTALMFMENHAARSLLRHLPGEPRVLEYDAGTVSYEVGLTATATAPRRSWQPTRRAAADCAGAA